MFKTIADKEAYATIAHKMESKVANWSASTQTQSKIGICVSKVDLKSLNYYVVSDLGDCLYVSEQSESCKKALDRVRH